MKAEFQDLLNVNLEDYINSSYPAVSLAEAVRRLLPDTEVITVAGTGVVPSEPADIPAAAAAVRRPTWSSSMLAARVRGSGKDLPRGRARTRRTSTCRRSRWSSSTW
jgi:hypothetical protein